MSAELVNVAMVRLLDLPRAQFFMCVIRDNHCNYYFVGLFKNKVSSTMHILSIP